MEPCAGSGGPSSGGGLGQGMWYIERKAHLRTILSRGYYTQDEAESVAEARFPGESCTIRFIAEGDATV